MTYFSINGEEDLAPAFRALKEEGNFGYELHIVKPKRTGKQNNSIQKYCRIMAKKLNDAGLDMRKVLKPEVEIPWTCDSFRDNMFNKISLAMFNKTSSELDTKEPSEVHKVLDKHLMEKFNLGNKFPSNR